jgi:hypothetical protein
MQPLLMIRTTADKRTLRRAWRGRVEPCVIGEAPDVTRVHIALLPSADMGRRLNRRAMRKLEGLIRDGGVLFAMAPGVKRDTAFGLLRLGVTLLDPEGVHQYLTAAALERWLGLLGRDTVSELTVCVQGAGSRWGSLWICLLSGWVRYLTVTGPEDKLAGLQREMLASDGTVLQIGGSTRADIRIVLEGDVLPGDERMLVDARPMGVGIIPRAIRCGWPALPVPDPRLRTMESLLVGLYHTHGHRLFTAYTPPRVSRPDMGDILAGVPLKGFLVGDNILTFDRMRVQQYQAWQVLAQKRRLRAGF